MRRLALVLGLGLLAACGASEVDERSFVDAQAAVSHVGWLGAQVQPLTTVLKVRHEDETHVPGGVVVRDLTADQPLAKAGLRVGDVIVRVDGKWLPVTDNMHRKLVERVEQAVSGGKKQIPLGVYRKGTLETFAVASDLEPMENGLPVDVARFHAGARSAADAFPADRAGAVAWAILGLALVAGAHDDADLLRKARDVVAEAAEDANTDTATLCWCLLFEAERVGALPKEYILVTKPNGGGPASTDPQPGAGSRRVITPEMLQEMMKGGKIKIGGGGTGGPPVTPAAEENEPAPSTEAEPQDEPDAKKRDDAEKRAAKKADDDEKAEEKKEKTEEEKKQEAEEKKREAKEAARKQATEQAQRMKSLIERYDKERLPKLQRLESIAQALVERQHEGGGWSAGGRPDAATTSLALWALGSVMRAGGTVDLLGVERGVGFLREALHEGKLAIEVAKGADRRTEVGRATLGGLALRALGCPEEDQMLKALWKFSDRLGKELLNAEGDRTTPLIATAVARRGRALATWQTFFDEFRLGLVTQQTPDGCFQPLDDGPLGDVASSTAAGALLYALQGARVPVLLGIAENPLAPRWNAEGEILLGKASPAAPSPQGQPSRAEMLEMLKKAGVQLPGK